MRCTSRDVKRLRVPGSMAALSAPVLAALILTAGPVDSAFAQKVGEAETIVGSVFGETINKTLRVGASLGFRQKVRVGDQSAAGIRFIDDTTLSIGAKTSIVIDEFVYDPGRGVVQGSISLARGFMRFASKRGVGKVQIKTTIGSIGVRGTTFDTLAKPNGLEVAVHEGVVQVDARGASRVVLAGEVLRIDGSGQVQASRVPSQEMTEKASALLTSFATAGRRLKQQALYVRAKSGRGAGGDLVERSADDILALDLRQGRVLIHMLDQLAPRHVARIKALAAEGFYDGLSFFDVKSDFAAITGDPTSTGGGGSGRNIDAEFSKAAFEVGSVGMIRGRDDPNSADSQFFIAFKKLPHLVGKYTKWGQVISGMEYVTALAQGRPPRHPDQVKSMRLLSQAP